MSEKESTVGWIGSWLQTAKEKSEGLLGVVSQDLLEFSNVMRSDATRVADEVIKAVKDKQQNKQADDKKTSLFDRSKMELHSLQSSTDTYEQDPSQEEFPVWREEFSLDTHRLDISELLANNTQVRSIFTQLVPKRVSNHDFWTRYFFHQKTVQDESLRRQELMKRVEKEDSELGWDEEDDEEIENDFTTTTTTTTYTTSTTTKPTTTTTTPNESLTTATTPITITTTATPSTTAINNTTSTIPTTQHTSITSTICDNTTTISTTNIPTILATTTPTTSINNTHITTPTITNRITTTTPTNQTTTPTFPTPTTTATTAIPAATTPTTPTTTSTFPTTTPTTTNDSTPNMDGDDSDTHSEEVISKGSSSDDWVKDFDGDLEAGQTFGAKQIGDLKAEKDDDGGDDDDNGVGDDGDDNDEVGDNADNSKEDDFKSKSSVEALTSGDTKESKYDDEVGGDKCDDDVISERREGGENKDGKKQDDWDDW